MIVVDSSALVAILLGEPESEMFLDKIASERCVFSTVNAHETATVLRARHGSTAVERLWSLLNERNIEIATKTVESRLLFKGNDFAHTDVMRAL